MKWWHQILVFWMLSFKSICHCPPSPSSRGSLVTLLFLPLKWYHLHIWSCWYFSWQSWFQLVIHPTQHFPWCVMYSIHNVNKQSDSIQPWRTPFPILNQSFVPCPFLVKKNKQGKLCGDPHGFSSSKIPFRSKIFAPDWRVRLFRSSSSISTCSGHCLSEAVWH